MTKVWYRKFDEREIRVGEVLAATDRIVIIKPASGPNVATFPGLYFATESEAIKDVIRDIDNLQARRMESIEEARKQIAEARKKIANSREFLAKDRRDRNRYARRLRTVKT